MIFTRQQRFLRLSETAYLTVHIYLQEANVAWFTDALFQELLQAVKPKLKQKAAELRENKNPAASIYKNSALQVAFYVDRLESSGHLLVQEPLVKSESPDASQHLFSYQPLRRTANVLVLVPEPFDANNQIELPKVLNVQVEP
ncbi:hypothetical protein DL89DRAFT_267366 [Linderina pennispora]|uniref:Uncharacterized protein n=1 Tax=Linderina pennispora TaxID=61395 RepID=A0A1Y1W9E9_9FUNG|nr:uncharacterized protein DL89DRAFT_267366 [Linderina pennispora]ORX70151.1 hypothetical protein DL89DRAFT_267366 [Linderina pennispora]